MAALRVFQQAGTVADTDFLALEVLPILWSFSLGPLLNLRQFEQFMALIKTLSNKIEREQKKKLQELSSEEAGGFQNGTKGSSQTANDLDQAGTDNNFERLVLGKGPAASSQGARHSERTGTKVFGRSLKGRDGPASAILRARAQVRAGRACGRCRVTG